MVPVYMFLVDVCVEDRPIHYGCMLPAVYNEGEPAILPFDMFGMSDGTEESINISASPDTLPAHPDFEDPEDDQTTIELGENLPTDSDFIGHRHSQEAALSQTNLSP